MKYLIPLFVIALMLVGCTSNPTSEFSDNLDMESEIELGIRATLVAVRIDEGVKATIEANTPEPAPTSDWIPDWATGGTSQDAVQQNPVYTTSPLPNIQSEPSTPNAPIPAMGLKPSAIQATPTSFPNPTQVPVIAYVPTETPTPVPTMVPTPTYVAIPTAVPTPVPAPTPTPIPTLTPTPTYVVIPTAVPTPVPAPTPTPMPTAPPVPTSVPTPTSPPTPTPTPVSVGESLPTRITSDLTLNMGQSYTVEAATLIEPGIKLDISPGVTVHFKPDSYLRVEGTIKIQGTAENKIILKLSDGYVYPENTWRGITFPGGTVTDNVISHAVISNTSGFGETGTPYNIENSIFSYNTGGIWADNIYDSTISNNIVPTGTSGGDWIISWVSRDVRRSLINNNTGQLGGASGECSDNVIENNKSSVNPAVPLTPGNTYEVWFECAPMMNNVIQGNVVQQNILGGGGEGVRNNDFVNNISYTYLFGGVESAFCNPRFALNNIEGNITHGPLIDLEHCSTAGSQNNIVNNEYADYVVKAPRRYPSSPEEIDISGNYWGITNSDEFEDLLFDYIDDFNYSRIVHEPMIQSTISEAGPN